MAYVNWGKYIDSPLTWCVQAGDWAPFYFLNYQHSPMSGEQIAKALANPGSYDHRLFLETYTVYDVGVVPLLAYSDWHQANAVDRYRYEYELKWQTFPPSELWVVGVGSWGGNAISFGNYPVDFVPGDNWYLLEDALRSFTTVQQFLDLFSIPAVGVYPAEASATIRLSATYDVYEYHQGLSNSRNLVGTISFNQTRAVHWVIYDIPQPFTVFSEAGDCWSTPDHVHAGSDIIKTQIVWQNDVAPDHVTKGWVTRAWGSTHLEYWTGTIPAGSVGRQQRNFQHTAAEIAGHDPAAGETITLVAATGRLEETFESDRLTWTFRVDPLPAPNPEVVPDKCTCSKSFTQGVAPDEAVTFNVVIHRHTPDHDKYQTTSAYIGVSCKGHTQTLWSGTFPAGTTELTKTFKVSPKQLAGAAVGDENIVPVFITGNGTAYNSADTDYYWVPNNGQGLSVQPLIDVPHGQIYVQSTPAGASFTISGPVILGGMTPYTSQDVPTGQYTINWGAMVGYTKPKNTTAPLSSGGTITFNGTYTVGDDEPPDDEPPDGGVAMSNAGPLMLALGGAMALALFIKRRR